MIKILFKLLLIIVAGYIAVQIPFVRDQVDGFKASLLEKWGNVTSEAERVKEQVDEARATVNEIREKVGNAQESYNEFKTKVTQTTDAMSDAAAKLNSAVEAFSGSEEEAEPATP